MSAEAPRCPVCGTDLHRAREVEALRAQLADAEADYAKALSHPRADGLDEAGDRLRRLYRRLAGMDGGS